VLLLLHVLLAVLLFSSSILSGFVSLGRRCSPEAPKPLAAVAAPGEVFTCFWDYSRFQTIERGRAAVSFESTGDALPRQYRICKAWLTSSSARL